MGKYLDPLYLKKYLNLRFNLWYICDEPNDQLTIHVAKGQGHSLTFLQDQIDSAIHQHLQTCFPLRPLSRLELNFMWSLSGIE